MKQYAVRITRQARAHLRGIKKYIEEELLEPDVAKCYVIIKYVQKFRNKNVQMVSS